MTRERTGTEPVDLAGPEFTADPYPSYARLREFGGPVRSERWDAWYVTGYEQCHRVLSTPEVFDDTGQQYLRGLQAAVLSGATGWRCPPVPPQAEEFAEQRLEGRRTTGRALATRFIDTLWPRFTQDCADAADTLVGRAMDGPVDLVTDYAVPLATRLLGDVMAMGEDELPAFRAWAESTYAEHAPDDATQRGVAKDVRSVLAHQAVRRLRSPVEDFVGYLVAHPGAHRTDGPPLTAHLEFVVSTGLMIARVTHQGLVLSFGTLLNALAGRPEDLAALRADRALLPNVVEEGLRYDSSTQALGRLTRTETELGGVRIPAGELLVVFTGSANRDERRFPDADTFDIRRDVKTAARHLSFGHGVSSCLGAAMSRRALAAMLDALVQRTTGLSMLHNGQWFDEFMTRGPIRLPIDLQR